MSIFIASHVPGCLSCAHFSGPVNSEHCEACYAGEGEDWPGYVPHGIQTGQEKYVAGSPTNGRAAVRVAVQGQTPASDPEKSVSSGHFMGYVAQVYGLGAGQHAQRLRYGPSTRSARRSRRVE